MEDKITQAVQEATAHLQNVSADDVRKIVREELAHFMTQSKFVFSRPIQIQDGNDIVLGQTNGTRFGTAASQLLSFFGVTPRIQYPTGYLLAATGGAVIDVQARARIADLNNLIVGFGLAKDVT